MLKKLWAASTLAAVGALLVASTAMAAQPVYKDGTGVITQTCGGELDKTLVPAFGCDGINGPNDYDVYFIAHTSTFRVITYNNHLFLSKIVMVASKPSYATCKASNPGFNEYKAKLNVGHWFCVLTSEGRYARVQITKVVTGGPMSIAYRTWCKLGDGC